MKKKSAPPGCELTEIGEYAGIKISAVSDMMGHQVIYQGKGIHLLSQPLETHQAAVEVGKRVLEKGRDGYDKWIDLNATAITTQLAMIATAQLRHQGHLPS